ncbi:hypothetical protein BKA93DRAFT_777463 [Sparassis latifolia]
MQMIASTPASLPIRRITKNGLVRRTTPSNSGTPQGTPHTPVSSAAVRNPNLKRHATGGGHRTASPNLFAMVVQEGQENVPLTVFPCDNV